MTRSSPVGDFLHRQVRLRVADLLIAAFSGAVTAASATWLLGVSGWFLAGAALAGASGPLALQAFNYLLPGAAMRGLAIARTAGRYGERLFGHRAAFLALAALRPALFAGLAASTPETALRLSSGEAAARLVQDVDAVETEFVRRSAPWAAAAAAGAAVAVIAPASPWAAIAYISGLAMQIAVGRTFAGRLTDEPGRDQLRAGGRLKDGLGAYLPAAAELHCFGLTARIVDVLMAHDAELGRSSMRRNDGEALLGVIQAGLAAPTLAAVAALSWRAPMPLAALAVLGALAGMEGVTGLLRAAQQRGAYREAVDRLDVFLARPVATGAPPSSDTIEIAGHALAHGSRLGLAGPSGCGKTSTLEMLIGLRRAPPGLIRIGGVALEHQPLGWARGLFAFAPQDARLLTGTVAENLRLGAPDSGEADLWLALADAQLADRIRTLPLGLETWIGDGGEILSGGERRRLALARAYLRPAPWLLLDEPTEGLDSLTEANVIGALQSRVQRTGQGIILVSHRPSPLTLCPIVLDYPLIAAQPT